VERGIEPRVVFNWSVGLEIITIPKEAELVWLQTEVFRRPFATWTKKIERRRDVFLGYASSSRGLALNMKRFLTQLGVTTLDWYDDFAPGRTILDQITDASLRCGGGIFLFTGDDKVDSAGESAVPRDNVVLEAGFFISAKGKDRVLIVREKVSKMPADLGGDIYAMLEEKSDISPIESSIRAFTANL
jgi:predicted nucleotide-binding protein